MTKTHRPDTVEIFDPIDRWMHIAAMAGIVGTLITGPLLQSPHLGRAVGINPGTLTLIHGLSAGLALGAWLFHLARVVLAWLEGSNPWGLAPRPADLGQLFKGVTWSLRLSGNAPQRGRFNYRERLPYLAFMLAAPLMALTGIALSQPGRFFALFGAQGLITMAAVHGAMGLVLVVVLIWHFYFAMLQPGLLWFNSSWITGKARWETMEQVRPDWCAELMGELHKGLESTVADEENASVQELLDMGNNAAKRHHYSDACQYFEEALHLYPGYPQALYNLGLVLARMGDRAGARKALEQYLEQDQFGPGAKRARLLLERMTPNVAPKGGSNG